MCKTLFLFIEQEGQNVDKSTTFIENSYVKACGNVRLFQGKINIVAFRIFKLETTNELTSHILEVIYSHMYHTVLKEQVRDECYLNIFKRISCCSIV